MSALSNLSDIKCRMCGTRLLKNRVQCHQCRAMNIPTTPKKTENGFADDGTILLSDVLDLNQARLRTGHWDANFGNPPGIPNDAVILVGGNPGAGKSTLAIQLASAMSISSGKEVLYLPTEENGMQIKARAIRLGLSAINRIRIVPLEAMQDVSLESILAGRVFCGVILDSISGLTKDLAKAVEIVQSFKLFATMHLTPVLVVNHVTKEGDRAGSMDLQHAGDASLMLSKDEKDVVQSARLMGDDTYYDMAELRTLYTEKNRNGPSGVETTYAMLANGLRAVELEENEGDE